MKDYQKEKVYKVLSSVLIEAGVQVRREELKRGYGWKTLSGSCRVHGDKVIFVDRRMPQEEQISFLKGIIHARNIPISDHHQKELNDLDPSQSVRQSV